MKRTVVVSLFVLLAVSTARAAGVEKGVEASRGVIREMVEALRAELSEAIAKGGPAHAINACAESAWKVQSRVEKKLNAKVGRVSLRPRNPANEPDAWERSVLEKFEKRKAAGEPVGKLEYYVVTKIDGKPVLRYMKAIPTGQVCIKCHGRWVDKDVEEAIRKAYPGDKARGFEVGDIRGAFTVTQPLRD